MIEWFSQTAAARASRWGRFCELEPARGIQVEALRHAPRARSELRWQGRHDLELGRCHDRSKPERRGRARQAPQEHRLGLVGRQAGQTRPVAVNEADTAVRASLGVDRDARLGERLDVAVDRPDGYLELLGQFRGRHPTAGLEQEQDVDEPSWRASCKRTR